jgi:hypothetical protein
MSEPQRDVQQVGLLTAAEKSANAPKGTDDMWFAPSENPFIQGCCDCGLAHRITYRIDSEGLSLNFQRDYEATEHLQARLGKERQAAKQVVADGLLELAGELKMGHRVTKDAAIDLLCEAADLLFSVVAAPDAQKAGA